MKRRIRTSMALFVCVTCILCLLTGCFFNGNASGVNKFEALNADDIVFIQMDPPQEGDKIAVITTDLGEIRIRLFGVQSPKAVENFTTLAESGKYDGYQAYKITTNRAFIAAKSDGSGDCIYGENFENQYSAKLWHFPGAVASISDEAGKGDSRFYIVGHAAISDEIMEEMKQNNFPQKVIDQYALLGGCPELDWACNIFGQVYEGLDIVDKINASETDEQGFPKEKISIISVKIETYTAEKTEESQ